MMEITMNAEKKTLMTGKIFGQVAKELGFQGRGVTRYLEYPTYYLLVNHQKSAYSKRCYINVKIVYKELSEKSFSDEDLQNAFKIYSPVPGHVTTRIECFMPDYLPEYKNDLQKLMDACVDDGKMDELKCLLKDALCKVIAFVEKNHDRKTIRKLNDERKFSAMLYKEV
jgi:hypothetical protein